MWLKSLQKKHVWKMKHISKETGLPEASLASWFKAGSIAPEKYWTRIGQFLRSKGLEYSSERVIELYTLQRREFGFLVDCEECATQLFVRELCPRDGKWRRKLGQGDTAKLILV